MVEEKRKGKVSLEINGERVRVPERITIKDALREAGYHIPSASEEAGIFAPCAVEVDGEVKPA